MRPLTGQCLIEMLLPESRTAGGLEIPEDAQETAIKGIVRDIGYWRRAKNGLYHLPEIHNGDTVIVSKYSGQKLNDDLGGKLRLVKIDDVIAVMTQ